jgi:AbrB family looped-hinge helix DNA binding protein
MEDGMTTVTVSPKYQIVIPRKVRESMGIQPGEKIRVFQYGDRIEFIPVRRMRAMRGFLKGIDTAVERDEDRT